MKILVCAKRVVDPNVKVRVMADHSNVDIEHSKMSLNPFDENAIEAAVQLKEQGKVDEIVALSIGKPKVEDNLRTALARGADRGILISTEETIAPIDIAKIISLIYQQEQPDLILMGKQASDDDSAQVPQMLSSLLSLPIASFASQISLEANKLTVQSETDFGHEMLELQLPAIISADLALNEPRFIKLPALMQAKKKPIVKIELNSLNLNLKPRTRLIRVDDGEVKKNCKFLSSMDEIKAVLNVGKE